MVTFKILNSAIKKNKQKKQHISDATLLSIVICIKVGYKHVWCEQFVVRLL